MQNDDYAQNSYYSNVLNMFQKKRAEIKLVLLGA